MLNQVRRKWIFFQKIIAGLKVPDTFKQISTCDVLFLCHDVDRGLDIDGRAFSQILDSLALQIEDKGYKTSFLSHPFSTLTPNQTSSGTVTLNRSYFFRMVIGRLLKLTKFTRINYLRERLWKSVLKRTSAQVVVTIGTSVELCTACSKAHVRLIEILHGYRYEYIPWGYDLRRQIELPHQIWALDRLSSKTFSELSPDTTFCQTVRNPWHEYLRISNSIESSIFQRWNRDLAMIRDERQKGKKVILVSLQWGYEQNEDFRGVFSNSLFPEEIEDVVKKTVNDCIWIFRLHQVQVRENLYEKSRERLETFTVQNANVLSTSLQMVPLPLVIENLDLHMTPGSGTTAECLLYGVPTLFLDIKSAVKSQLEKSYSEELASSQVHFWDGTGEHLETWISSMSSSGYRLEDSVLSASNLIERMITETPKFEQL